MRVFLLRRKLQCHMYLLNVRANKGWFVFKNIKPVTKDYDIKAIDISWQTNGSTFYLLDQSSYLWAVGNGGRGSFGNGEGANFTQSVFAPAMANMQYARLIQGISGALVNSYITSPVITAKIKNILGKT